MCSLNKTCALIVRFRISDEVLLTYYIIRSFVGRHMSTNVEAYIQAHIAYIQTGIHTAIHTDRYTDRHRQVVLEAVNSLYL